MKNYRIMQGTLLCGEKVWMADNFFTRLRGLMFRKKLDEGEGMFLKNCSSIHCFFMRFPIDVIYLDKKMSVIGTETVMPNRIGSYFRGTKHVLELEKGKASLVKVGDVMEIVPNLS